MARMDNAHALIVGIAGYRNVNPLPKTVLDDARDLYKVLVDPALCGYPVDPTRVKLLPQEAATRENLLTELNRLAERVDTDSVVFLYFSPPGPVDRDQGSEPTGELGLSQDERNQAGVRARWVRGLPQDDKK